MAQIHDFLASQVDEGGVSTLPDGLADGLLAAYDADMSVPAAAIGQRDEQVAALTAELLATKAANWDLLQSVPTEDTGDSTASSDPDNSQNDDDADEPDIDTFFGAAN